MQDGDAEEDKPKGEQEMISVVYVHWAMSEERSALMRRSLLSLIESEPTQILVADNGGSVEDSKWLLELCEAKKIAVYIRFRENMHFAYARNALLKLADQPYIAIADNDIIFEKGWWQECVEYLKGAEEKVIATPLVPDLAHRASRFWVGEHRGWQLNLRAGSSCFVMDRKAYAEFGDFQLHNMAGSKYADTIVGKGYRVAVMPQCKANDIGERRGYNWREPHYSQTL